MPRANKTLQIIFNSPIDQEVHARRKCRLISLLNIPLMRLKTSRGAPIQDYLPILKLVIIDMNIHLVTRISNKEEGIFRSLA